jgi:Domain of unknown function (DUF6089)
MVKKSGIFLLLLSCTYMELKAQQWTADFFVGTANYQGDLLEKRYTMQNSKFAAGFGAGYKFNGHFKVRTLLSFGKVTADDKDNTDPFLVARNLNFFSNISELSLTVHYDILDLNYHRVTPYLFAGLGIFHFNPYTYDSMGNKVMLKPLSTEGQGLTAYPDRKPYSLMQFNIPFGAGIKFAINENISLAWEIGLRKTFTDFLDDLSTTYVDEATLLAERGPVAASLAYRGDELKNSPGVYPPDGTVRGGPEFKDWYYFSGITASYNLPVGLTKRNSKLGSTSCPKPVF